jgi:hypothetical protein
MGTYVEEQRLVSPSDMDVSVAPIVHKLGTYGKGCLGQLLFIHIMTETHLVAQVHVSVDGSLGELSSVLLPVQVSVYCCPFRRLSRSARLLLL